jgi:hypothetical protein
MKISRNSLCACGSGKKYKQCCGLKEQKTPTIVFVALFIGVMIVTGAIYLTRDTGADQPANAGAPAAAAPSPSGSGSAPTDGVPGSPQPPGPVPAGKVWNVEHGHWHDAPGASPTPGVTAQPGATPAAAQPELKPGPQPPGPVPAGKVWSAEHGHWHDAPTK